MRLLAISDLHLGHAANRDALERLSPHPDDWIILAGDMGEQPVHLELALRVFGAKFGRVFWVPGNHDLWCPPEARDRTRGQARYDELVAICRRAGAVTPEDPFVEWPGEPGTFIVPMFLLFDYTFRPGDIPPDQALAWAREAGVVCRDERLLDPVAVANPSCLVPCALRLHRKPAREPARGRPDDSREPLAAPVRSGPAAAHSALFHLVRHGDHRGVGTPFPRTRGRLRPPAPAHHDVAAGCALRGSVPGLSARLAFGAGHRLVSPRDCSWPCGGGVSLRARPRSIPVRDGRIGAGVTHRPDREAESGV